MFGAGFSGIVLGANSMAKSSSRKKTAPANPSLQYAPPGWKTLLQFSLLVAAVGWIYWPALRGDWLWDDDRYITDNLLLRTFAGLEKIWLQPGLTSDYYPVEATVQWVQWHLWGMETLGYHLTNVVLHSVSALLVWRLLGKFHLKFAWLGGLLFAVHPLQVESVAWVAELKNTLSLPLLLGAMCRYMDFDEEKRPRDYWLALGLFVIAMLCKLSVVLLPLVILLYAWWKRGRISGKDLKASAPFFAAALALGLITILSGAWDKQFHPEQAGFVPPGGIFGRVALAGQALSFYFSKVFLPVDLLPIYPLWAVDYTSLLDYLPWLVWGGAIFWLWSKRETWGRHVLLGLGFFLINLMPCPGFIPVPNMGYAWVMDHFLYLPIIGLIGIVVAGLGQIYARARAFLRPYGHGFLALVVLGFAWESHGYARLYVDQPKLWTYTLARNPQAWLAHNNLGYALYLKGRVPEAIAHYEQALQAKPDYAEAHNNLGLALMQTGRLPEAIEQFTQALAIHSGYVEARNNLGLALMHSGRVPEAITEYELAVKIDPDYAGAYSNWGNALMQVGRPAEALSLFEQALKINPDADEAHNNLGNALVQTGRLAEAKEQYELSIKINPNYAGAYYNLGNIFMQQGRFAEAISPYEQALKIDPDNPEFHNNLANALGQSGHFAEAVAEYEQALRLKPDYAAARNNLAHLQAYLQNLPANK